MSSKKQQIPAIRFNGFTDAWEQRKLKNISKVFIGLVTTMTENYRDSGTLLIRNSDIKENRFEFSENPIHLDEQFAEANNSRRLRYGDVVTVHTGDIGTSAVIAENEVGAIGFATINTRPNPEVLDSKYLAAYFNTPVHKNYATKMATGDGRSNYNLKDFTKLVIPVPSLKEQEKIGELLKCLESTIALHQRQLDNYKELKKAMLQKMFPQSGERIPEVRFDGFTEEWEQYEISEVADMFDNLRIPVTASERIAGDTPYYGANGIQDYVDGYTHDGEFVLVAEDGANDLINYPVNYVNGQIWVNNHAHVLSGKSEILDNLFLTSRVKSTNISTFLVGGGRAKLNGETLKKIPIIIPGYIEQQKIGTFFKKLDDDIECHKQKVNNYQQLKVTMLQQMFV